MIDSEPNFFKDPEVIEDPHAYFAAMRARSPVCREGYFGTLMVTGFDAVSQVLNTRDGTYSSAFSIVGPIPPLPFQPESGRVADQLEAVRASLPWAAHIVCFDGERHAAARTLLMNLLTPMRIKANGDYLRQLSDQLIDQFIDSGYCDVMPQYAHATTTYAISDLMGIPEADRAELLTLIGAPPSQIEGDAIHKAGPDPLVFLKERFDAYLTERRSSPRFDLMSELVHSRFHDGSEPDFELLSNLARFLFAAGQDTTSRLIAMAIRVLAEQPALQDRLRREPERIGDFVEEVLRYDGPVKVGYRLAVRDTSIGDTPVPAGSLLTVCLSAASRDPAQFPDPASIDIDRKALRSHLGFSRGPHTCVGATLGRLEASIALERLLHRVRNIRIDEAYHGSDAERHFRYEPTYTFRSLADLHVRFDPA